MPTSPLGADAPTEPPPLRVICRGTRGSLPSPRPDTMRFGGNTPCVEVRTANDDCFIFDAGTGIRPLGLALDAAAEPVRADLFITHFHWDHIQGFPLFTSLYNPDAQLRVHGPPQGGVDVRRIITTQMSPVYFPIPLDALAARVEFANVADVPWRSGAAEVSAMRMNHPSHTLGYRIDAGGAAVAYLPDNELGDDPDAAWYARLVRFLDGVDLLLHDTTFTEAEYQRYRGWGHSTFEQAVRLAEEAGVRELAGFHHAPERTDADLSALHDALGDTLASRGSALTVRIATEGEVLEIAGTGRARP